MGYLEKLGEVVGSHRYARDLVESGSTLLTRPWWDGVQNTWTTEQQGMLHEARVAHGHPPRGLRSVNTQKP